MLNNKNVILVKPVRLWNELVFDINILNRGEVRMDFREYSYADEAVEGIDPEEEFSKETGPNDISRIMERKLYTNRSDKSLTDLVRMIDNGDLQLQPDYQRGYVWTNKQASKFIESILMGIPVPTIFFSENFDGTFEVIDGQQRLTALHKFWNNQLKLGWLETLTEFNGTKFDDLKSDFPVQRRILENSRSMSVVVLEKESSRDVKYDVFQRINEGAIKLSPQELRNVIYRGELVTSIERLATDSSIGFARLFKANSQAVLRKSNQEILVRMLAIQELTYISEEKLKLDSRYNGRLNSAIIEFMEKYRNDATKISEIEQEFKRVMENVYNLFGSESFKLPSEKIDGSFTVMPVLNKTMAEFIYILFVNIPNENVLTLGKSFVKEAIYQEVYENIELFQRATGNTSTLTKRIGIVNDLLNRFSRGK